ncbi:MAG: Error-prone repair protein ImuA [Chitinophagaceae bacterium]|nr:MAG: Error-prone repair protein ImuA [Chitinophagaceae bacterium]
MLPEKADILARLQQEVLQLQGFKAPRAHVLDDTGLGRINAAFPNALFPRSALHEFVCAAPEEAAASGAFIAGLLSAFMRRGGAALWVGTERRIFPPALRSFGLRPEQVIFLDVKTEKDATWALGEALRCGALAAVVGELRDLSFTDSRRFQLAIEGSGVPCFALRRREPTGATTAVARWRIRPVASRTDDGLPGIGHPRWQVQLLKVRNGHPGSWELEWAGGRFRHVPKLAAVPAAHTKTG